MADKLYEHIYFNGKERAGFDKLVIEGLITQSFKAFVKEAYFDSINKVRIQNINKVVGEVRGGSDGL